MDDTYLKELSDVDILSVKKELLADIKEVDFVCDGVIVKINYAETGDTLEDKLKQYFLSL